jgi:hypothetical protein
MPLKDATALRSAVAKKQQEGVMSAPVARADIQYKGKRCQGMTMAGGGSHLVTGDGSCAIALNHFPNASSDASHSTFDVPLPLT